MSCSTSRSRSVSLLTPAGSWRVASIPSMVPDARVQWHCVDGPDEWKYTSITFELKPSGDQTAVVFTHSDWREPVEFMHHCSTKWAHYLIGLKAGLEGGKHTPWPSDMAVSSWG